MDFCTAAPLYGSWVSLSPGALTFFFGTVEHCFSVAHHLGGVGNLRVSDFFQFVGSLPTCKVSYINKLVCVAFAGSGENWAEKKMKVRVCVLLLLKRGRKKRMRSKFLKHSFVREFAIIVCHSFSDLWVCFGGGFQTKKDGATTFDLGNGHVS